jgi:uncharacterized protein GlcG (DUF336 family)
VKLTFPVASLLSRVAEVEAEAMAVPMAIAFADDTADLIFFGKMTGALPASGDIAVNKAYTAAALRLATHEVGRLAEPGQTLYGLQHATDRRIVLFGGGLPLTADGRVIGAVGISGGTVDQDLMVAETVREVLDRMVGIHHQLAPTLPGGLATPHQTRWFGRHLAAALELEGVPLPDGWVDEVTGALLLLGKG